MCKKLMFTGRKATSTRSNLYGSGECGGLIENTFSTFFETEKHDIYRFLKSHFGLGLTQIDPL